MAKINRNVAKTKAASLREDAGSGDDDGDSIKAARHEAAVREEALSSLLVSTFAGAELAQRLPLEQPQGENVSVWLIFVEVCFFLSSIRCRVSLRVIHLSEDFSVD